MVGRFHFVAREMGIRIKSVKYKNSDYWKVLAIFLITAGGVIKLKEIFPGKVPERDLAVCHIPGTCITNHQNPLIGILPLMGLFITACRDLIIPSL